MDPTSTLVLRFNMRDDLLQISSLTAATVVSLGKIRNDVVNYLVLMIAFIFFAHHSLAPIFPGARIKALQSTLEETEHILQLALSESLRDRLPHFVLQIELDLLCAKLVASHLQSDSLRAKSLPWKDLLPFLRGISLKAARCQWQVKELQITVLLALEAERQRRYNDNIRDKQIVMSTLLSMGATSEGRAAIQTPGWTPTHTGYAHSA